VKGLIHFAAVALVVACTSTSQVTPADLWKQPEAQLLSPGSENLDRREAEARQTIEGPSPASIGYLLGGQDTAAQVEAFYVTELAASGWQPPTDNRAGALRIPTTSELSARSWRKGDLVFRLGILDMSDPYAEGPSEGFASVYRISLVDRPTKPTKS
jgi:hypothetical protein